MAWQHLAQSADASLAKGSPEEGATFAKVHLAIKMQNYSGALRTLRTHILAHPDSYVAYDLRSLCAMHCNDFQQARDDALHCTSINPSWARGWARLGTAQLCAGHARAAVAAYEKGLQLDSRNEEMRAGLELAKRAMDNCKDRRKAMHE